MDFLGRPINSTFDEDIDIQNHDLEGVKQIEAKQLNVNELLIGEMDVNDEIIKLKQQVSRLEQIIQELTQTDGPLNFLAET